MSPSAVQHRRDSGVARLLRGWIIAALAVLLAAGGHQAAHSLMHGATEYLPWELLGFSAALTAPVAVGLASRGISTLSTAITTVVAQIAFHVLYSLPYSGTLRAAAGHDHHGHNHSVQWAVPHVEHAAHGSTAGDSVMLIAHIVAAALTTFVVVHGERSLLAIIQWLTLAPVRMVLRARHVIVARPKILLPVGTQWVPRPMNVAQTRSTRGPPVLA